MQAKHGTEMAEQNTESIDKTTGVGVESRLFWEEKASEYTLPFEEKALARTNRIIDLVESKGIGLQGKRILDIGSGPGTFALPLALRGASVTALDISSNMLQQLITEAHRLSINSVKTVRASWKEADPDAEKLTGTFDVVLSALSLAIECEADILKMERCSKQWCLCIATGKIERPALCNKIRLELGLSLNPRPDIREIQKVLEQMGRVFSFDSFSTAVREKKTVKQLVEEIGKSLEALGKVPDPALITATVSSMLKTAKTDGSIECERNGETGILVWRVDEN
ncbi:MAG TPA: class I SAM-dependent methyltransferase [Syntrophorhabdaceae bacterium]|nr:class I SAM-dependent methyltransferase [Syntrophorhabdaceae bacterium]